MSQDPDLALSDLRILDLTRAVAGPTCTRMLVEMGADVIKVEPAPAGDLTRGVSVFRNDRSLYYVQQNRGKQSFCVNLKDPRGIALVAELASQVDAVVENFRPGVMEAIGLGYDRLRELKSDIILCSISAFGQTGPLAEKPGYDFIAQAYSGIMSMIGEPGKAPNLVGAAIGDASTGVHAALGIVSAIHRRNRTGKGDHLDVAILDAYYGYHDANVVTYSGSNGEIEPTREGAHYAVVCPAGVFHAPGGFIVVMAFMHHWPDLCRAMNRDDLVAHPDFCDDSVRVQRKPEVTKLVEDWLATFADVDSAVNALMACDVPCAPVLSVADTVQNAHMRARGTVRTVEDPVHGPVDIPGHPIKWKNHPNNIELTAPTLGQHNESIMTQRLGKTAAELDALRRDGILLEKPS
ncbi:MAG: crotonobetainyl-CoA:carnitine CoA-transferase CaiB-like acyl-CoA transferase [Gammaproteobacteria bacterium]|jgi:crotonobetainyl-CoA:carnitine CoA-transferase CaiB-like acyl-CoA transferase